MNIFYLDGREIPFIEGESLLEAAMAAGIEIPHFCYHAALGSLGACRLCAVEVTDDQTGKGTRVVMSCLEPAKQGSQVSLTSGPAREARQGVIELLMSNHPHDCPVCDEGGECRLQDMTVACGPPYRRYRGRKRTFTNQQLGPLIHHEMNRCITCYRCTRFYREYAMGDDLGAMRLRNEIYFGRFRDGPLESPFAGNLVEICPTGVFTDKVFRQHFARSWDLETAPSICPHCSIGCNTLPGARHGTLRRVRNRFHPDINRHFICDRGRFGHAYNEHPQRPLTPRLHGNTVTCDAAFAAAAECIRLAGNALAGMGSVRESLSALSTLKSLCAAAEGIFAAFAEPDIEAAVTTAVTSMRAFGRTPGLGDIEQSDAIVIVGDITAHAPMMDLAIRQACRRDAFTLLLHSSPTPLAACCQQAIRISPAETTAWLEKLCMEMQQANHSAGHTDDITALLAKAERPLFLGVAETLGPEGINALTRLASLQADRGGLAMLLPGPNAYGAALLNGSGAGALLDAIERGEVNTLVITGSDPLGSGSLKDRWQRARARLQCLIVLDCIDTATGRDADIMLPVATWAEQDGICINYEGRAQAFATVFSRQPPLPSATELLQDLAQHAGIDLPVSDAALKSTLADFEPPAAGERGTSVSTTPALLAGETGHEADTAGAWQVALHAWYGEDALADYASALASLAPERVARIAPHCALAAELADGTALVLRCRSKSVRINLLFDAAVADNTVAIPRTVMDELGLVHGGFVHIEAAG